MVSYATDTIHVWTDDTIDQSILAVQFSVLDDRATSVVHILEKIVKFHKYITNISQIFHRYFTNISQILCSERWTQLCETNIGKEQSGGKSAEDMSWTNPLSKQKQMHWIAGNKGSDETHCAGKYWQHCICGRECHLWKGMCFRRKNIILMR